MVMNDQLVDPTTKHTTDPFPKQEQAPPGMTERMAYVWVLPKTARLPEKISVIVNTQIYKQRDNLYGTPGWFNEHELGRLTVPVEAVAAAGAAP